MKKAIYPVIFILLVPMIISCAGLKKGGKAVKEAGSVIARAEWPGDVSSDVATVRMTISAPDMNTVSQDFVFTGRDAMFGMHTVPAGDDRTVVLEGLNSGNRKIFEGMTSGISVEAGQVIDGGLIAMGPVRVSRLSETSIRAEAGDGEITIMWDSVAGADSYNIYMNSAPGASRKNFDARKSTTSNSYTWTGLNNGATYYFAVTAENSSGESADSNEVNASPGVTRKMPPAAGVPAAPSQVKTEAGDGTVTIRWDSVPGAESYGIYMNRSPGASRKNFDARKSTTSNSYTWTGLKNGTTYYFAVTAEDRDRESQSSREVRGIPGKSAAAAAATAAAAPVAAAPPPAPVAVPAVPAPKPTAPVVSGEKLTPKQLLRKADDLRAPGKNFVQDLKITFKKGDKESVNMTSVRVKNFKKSLVIYRYPPTQKGRVILMVDNNMWIYFPGTKKPVRISPAQQLLGQVSNADVARVVYNLDYTAESIEEDNSGKKPLLKMLLKAKSNGAAYGSINLWMTKGSYKLVKAKFFTLSGRLLKTIYYKGYKQLLGRERPTILEVHDAIKKSETTIMEYMDMRVEDTPDKYFQKTFMQRIPRVYP